MKDGIELLAEHYEKTYEATLKFWEQRNRTFLILLIVVGIATLLTLNVSQAQPLLADLIAKFFSIDDTFRVTELRASLPYGLIQSILLMVVLYLTVILYHRTTTILRNYKYLGDIEKETRENLQIPESKVAFSRESSYYMENKPLLSKFVGLSYIVMVGVLLTVFSGMRVYSDISTKNIFFTFIDVFLSIFALIFFGAYSYASSSIFKRLTSLLKGS